jgi:hypothetical protein
MKHPKARSPRVLRQEFPRLKSRTPTLWTHYCFAATVGGVPAAVVKHDCDRGMLAQGDPYSAFLACRMEGDRLAVNFPTRRLHPRKIC